MKRRTLVGLLAVMIMLLTACNGDPDPAASPTVSVSAEPSATPGTDEPADPPAPPPPPAPAPPGDPPAPPPVPVPPAGPAVLLGQPFWIDPGDTVAIADEALAVTFNEVLSDSRCPPFAQCIWEGNARVSVTMAKQGQQPATVELNTTSSGPADLVGPTSADYLDYEVTLVALGRGDVAQARLVVRRE